MSTETASTFWRRQTTYPFPFTKRRRIHELNYLLPRLERTGGARLLDLGCGDGSLLECLIRLTDFEQYFGFDIAAGLLAQIDPRVTTAIYDFSNPIPLPEVDATIVAGAIQYLFDDEAVARVLSFVTSPMVWVRSTCTLLDADEMVDRDGYAALYRTIAHTHALISRCFVVTAIDRVYPDEIESPFGTKQFYFEARRRS